MLRLLTCAEARRTGVPVSGSVNSSAAAESRTSCSPAYARPARRPHTASMLLLRRALPSLRSGAPCFPAVA